MKSNVLYRKSDRIRILKRVYEEFTADPHNGEILFLLGFTVYLSRCILMTTMFPSPSILLSLCEGLTLLLIGLKIMLFDTYTPRYLTVVMMLFICGGLIIVCSGYFSVMLWLLILVGAKDVSFEKILKIYILLNLAFMILAFCASSMDIIENLVYETTYRGQRQSFGYIYTTHFAAHVFFVLLAVFYLCKNTIKWYGYVLTCLIAYGVYYYCNARLDMVCIFLTVVLFGINNILRALREKEKAVGIRFKYAQKYKIWNGICKYISICIMPVLAAIGYFLSYFYSQSNEFLKGLDELLSARINLGKLGLERYGISLFGQNVPMVGSGKTTKGVEDYFFIDCSYLYVLLRYGLIFLAVLFIIYACICCKNKNDIEMMLVIIIVAISCFVDQHIVEAAYNPFGFALFAHTKIKQLQI